MESAAQIDRGKQTDGDEKMYLKNRYDRNRIFSIEQQDELGEKKAAVIGCGGLGGYSSSCFITELFPSTSAHPHNVAAVQTVKNPAKILFFIWISLQLRLPSGFSARQSSPIFWASQ